MKHNNPSPDTFVTRWRPLVETTRGPLVENEHCGAIAIAQADGTLIASLGDIRQPIFARSALKPFQALPGVRSGILNTYQFDEEALALMCASHSGEPRHTQGVHRILNTIGLPTTALQCGCHPPLYLRAGDPLPPETICALHHNCSGKHAGFLAYCVRQGWPITDYLNFNHPLQQEVRVAISSAANIADHQLVGAVDGCSAPTYALPLAGLAQAYAKLASRHIDPAFDTLFSAMTHHPWSVSGSGRSDAFFMSRRPGDLVSKVGAAGIQTIGIRSKGLGIAIKIADGDPHAAFTVATTVLIKLGIFTHEDLTQAPVEFLREMKNAAGITTGEIRAVFDF